MSEVKRAYLWFGGPSGWQVTSFNPLEDEAIGYRSDKYPDKTIWVNIEAYEALKKENEELKLHIAGRSEKYKIAMDKGVDVLSAEIKDLKAKLAKAEAVISFYASEDTWINKEFDENNNFIGWTQKKPNDVSIFPYSIGNSNGNFHCLGRRAREYLKGE